MRFGGSLVITFLLPRTFFSRRFPDSAIRSIGTWLANHDKGGVSSNPNIDEKVRIFSSVLQEHVNYHFPIKNVRLSSNDKPWMTTEIKRHINARQLLNFYSHSRSQQRHLAALVKQKISQEKERFYRRKVRAVYDKDPKT